MGLNRQITKIILTNDCFVHELKKFYKKYPEQGVAFVKEMDDRIELLLKNYSIDKLNNFIAENEKLKNIWNDLDNKIKTTILKEINFKIEEGLEFENHIKNKEKLSFVFLINNDLHAVYVNGLKYDLVSNYNRKDFERFKNCLRYDVAEIKTIKDNNELNNYLILNNKFPKWLSELNLE